MHELDVITGIHGFAAVMTVVELILKYFEHTHKSHARTMTRHNRKHR
jgi:hypothetical protein